MQKFIEPKTTELRTRILSGLRYGSLALAITFAAATSGLLLSNAAYGQSNISGDISGAVTDQSGAVVSNAQVTVTSQKNGQVKSDASGFFQLPDLLARIIVDRRKIFPLKLVIIAKKLPKLFVVAEK